MSEDRETTKALAIAGDQPTPHLAALERAPSAAVVAHVRANVEARAIVAQKFPRNIDQVRQDLLKDCKRKSFAAAAIYALPFGGEDSKPVTGPSIRFAEACLQHLGNIDVDVLPIYEDAQRIIQQVSVVDLEKNNRIVGVVNVEKTVERRYPPDDPSDVVGTRKNSRGKLNYICRAGEREMRPKVAAEVSKAMRTAVLRLVPAWLKDEALEQIHKTSVAEVAEDPDAHRKAIIDGFATVGVRAASLATYLGHDLGESSPAELVELRAVFLGIKEGMFTWPDALRSKTGVESDGEDDEGAKGAADVINAKIAEAKEKLAKKSAPKPADGAQPPAGQAPSAAGATAPAPAPQGDAPPATTTPPAAAAGGSSTAAAASEPAAKAPAESPSESKPAKRKRGDKREEATTDDVAGPPDDYEPGATG